MNKNFLDFITDDDIEKQGMKVLTKGRDYSGPNQYIQICDKDSIFDDKKYICHYEILHMHEDYLKYGNHKSNKIYVEIHFENKTYSPYFQPAISELLTNSELENFYWRPYCPGLRLKENGFTTKETAKILSNLKKLKSLTLNKLIDVYTTNIDIKLDWKSSFSLECGKNTSEKRALSEYHREPKEIYVIHEQIKKKLIKKLEANNSLLSTTDPIDASTLSPENPVNNNNYIDLAAKTKKGKIVFFEIKTAPDARLCIRQALGQLMEYAYYPHKNIANAQLLVVVGTGNKTHEIIEYIRKLNTIFHISIDYIQV